MWIGKVALFFIIAFLVFPHLPAGMQHDLHDMAHNANSVVRNNTTATISTASFHAQGLTDGIVAVMHTTGKYGTYLLRLALLLLLWATLPFLVSRKKDCHKQKT